MGKTRTVLCSTDMTRLEVRPFKRFGGGKARRDWEREREREADYLRLGSLIERLVSSPLLSHSTGASLNHAVYAHQVDKLDIWIASAQADDGPIWREPFLYKKVSLPPMEGRSSVL